MPEAIREPRTSVELRKAWRRSDPRIERDAELFWQKEDLLASPAAVGDRLGDLCLAGYDGDSLIALTTARIRFIDFLGTKLAMVRTATARDKRRNHLGIYMIARTRELLEQWSADNPAEEVMGMGTITQVRVEGIERAPALHEETRLIFIGWTANGEPMRVAWFPHGTVAIRRPLDFTPLAEEGQKSGPENADGN